MSDTYALLVVDAQNEFSAAGQRAVPDHDAALAAIREQVERARAEKRPIAWIRHHNRPHESRAFVPGSWGAELSPGLGPRDGFGPERLFTKDVYGAFAGTGLEEWLRGLGAGTVRISGFYTHMCVSTSAREALVRDFDVEIDPQATGARDLEHPLLGRLDAGEVRRGALLHLANMGARIVAGRGAATPA
jgi:nicotinamidase-related amidase